MGELDKNVIDLLEKRYFKEGEHSWSDLAHRVAASIAMAEKENDRPHWEAEFYNAINNMVFIPSTPCLINANKEGTGQLSSCFIIDLKDNIDSIYRAKGECAKIYQRNGGVGFNISVLRPEGDPVIAAGGKSCGAMGFMEEFDLTADVITRNNARKGALKIDMCDWHPDILKFISCKDETDKLNHMNISVALSDDFMTAVARDEDWNLIFPDYQDDKAYYDEHWTGDISDWTNSGHPIRIYQTLKARDLYHSIMEHAWRTGEPGVSFITRMDEANPNPELGHIKSTNPCFAGDMKLLTVDGYKRFDELCDKDVDIINCEGEISHSHVWCSGEKKTLCLTLCDKSQIICTEDHTFMTTNYQECKALNAKGEKLLPFVYYRPNHNLQYIKYGFIQGDGELGRLSSQHHQGINVNIGKRDGDIKDLFSNNKHTVSERSIYVQDIKQDLINLGFSNKSLPERIFPSSYKNWNIEQKASFLCGCYSANGSVVNHKRIAYKTTSKQFSDYLSSTLKNDFGIESYITTNKPVDCCFSNGIFHCQQSYDVNIGKYNGIVIFAEKIGFYQNYKRLSLDNLIYDRVPKVQRAEPYKVQRVYDFTEPIRHWGVVEGVIAHNCAEFCSVPYNSCNLGSINLLKCLSDNGQSFDLKKVEQAVKLGIRFLDDMITVNNLPLPKLRETTAAIRSVGLGTMGLADALYSMGVRYGSDESIQIIKRLYENIRDFAEMETQGLGRTKGNYPAYQENHWNGFPRRNSNLISLAPNGSIGTIAGVSCGIEPNFALAYTRSTSTGESYNIVNPILKKALIGHKIDIDSTIEKIKKDGGSIQEVWAIPSDIKNIFVSASDLTPSEHLKVMAALQPFVDLSISKTINMPYEATVEDVENVYKKAWEYGLKGVTIYRNNSRPNQTLSVEVKEKADIGQPKKLKPESELKRGEIISVDDDLLSMKRTIKNGCGKFYLHVDFDEVTGEPMETYIDVSSGGGCERNLQLISRLMSLALRSGVPIESIIDQCQSVKPCKAYTDRAKSHGDTSKGTSCSSAIGWALKDLNDKIRDRCFDDLEDEPELLAERHGASSEDTCEKCDILAGNQCEKCDKHEASAVCPECSFPLVHESGCITCPNCGWSKCG